MFNPVKRRTLHLLAYVFLAFAGLAAMPETATARGGEITVTNRLSIKSARKWNPRFWFGNLDEPMPPDDYRPDDKHRVRSWYFRNPTHNLTFYVIGITDKTFRRSGRHPDQVFNPRQGWNWALCKYKWVRLPFISYQKKSFSFYLGWRERGNFGGKLTFR
ncbi:MAG: hypothetical protein JWR26_2066 [Pedosphaera sp.]|nr:hypothetical protein [Pedosphaera sp.]